MASSVPHCPQQLDRSLLEEIWRCFLQRATQFGFNLCVEHLDGALESFHWIRLALGGVSGGFRNGLRLAVGDLLLIRPPNGPLKHVFF